jgi:thiol-disulfide isomerase/thioredoxin
MNKSHPIFLIFSLLLATAPLLAQNPPVAAVDTETTAAISLKFPPSGEVPVLQKEAEVRQVLSQHGSDLLVVNFWATFCGPCVEEMPYFMELARKYPENRVRVVGFTVDLHKMLDSDVKPFLKEKKVPYANYLLFLDDPEKVINGFASDWTGELPATFFYDRSGKQLAKFLGPMTREQLNAVTEKLLAGR